MGGKKIYLDYAASEPLKAKARTAMMKAVEHAGNPNSSAGIGPKMSGNIERAKCVIAATLNVDPGGIFFTPGATAGIYCAKRIIEESGQNAFFDEYKVHSAIKNMFIRSVDDGEAFVFPAVQNESGEIISWDRPGGKKNGLTVCDATAAYGHIPMDLKDSGIDILIAGAHKFGGPKGIGFVYLSGNALEYTDGTSLPSVFFGTPPYELVMGMEKAAIASIPTGFKTRRLHEIREALKNGIDGEAVESEHQYPGILAMHVKVPNDAVVQLCSRNGVIISSGAACTSGSQKPSAAYASLGLSAEEALETIRISFGPDISMEEIKKAISVINDAIAYLRG